MAETDEDEDLISKDRSELRNALLDMKRAADEHLYPKTSYSIETILSNDGNKIPILKITDEEHNVYKICRNNDGSITVTNSDGTEKLYDNIELPKAIPIPKAIPLATAHFQDDATIPKAIPIPNTTPIPKAIPLVTVADMSGSKTKVLDRLLKGGLIDTLQKMGVINPIYEQTTAPNGDPSHDFSYRSDSSSKISFVEKKDGRFAIAINSPDKKLAILKNSEQARGEESVFDLTDPTHLKQIRKQIEMYDELAFKDSETNSSKEKNDDEAPRVTSDTDKNFISIDSSDIKNAVFDTSHVISLYLKGEKYQFDSATYNKQENSYEFSATSESGQQYNISRLDNGKIIITDSNNKQFNYVATRNGEKIEVDTLAEYERKKSSPKKVEVAQGNGVLIDKLPREFEKEISKYFANRVDIDKKTARFDSETNTYSVNATKKFKDGQVSHYLITKSGSDEANFSVISGKNSNKNIAEGKNKSSSDIAGKNIDGITPRLIPNEEVGGYHKPGLLRTGIMVMECPAKQQKSCIGAPDPSKVYATLHICSAGYYTTCFGNTNLRGEKKSTKTSINVATAYEWMNEDLDKKVESIRRVLGKNEKGEYYYDKLAAYEQDALTSFAYNVKEVGETMRKNVRAYANALEGDDLDKITEARKDVNEIMSKYIKAAGKDNNGLINRRKGEVAWFNGDTDKLQDIMQSWKGISKEKFLNLWCESYKDADGSNLAVANGKIVKVQKPQPQVAEVAAQPKLETSEPPKKDDGMFAYLLEATGINKIFGSEANSVAPNSPSLPRANSSVKAEIIPVIIRP